MARESWSRPELEKVPLKQKRKLAEFVVTDDNELREVPRGKRNERLSALGQLVV